MVQYRYYMPLCCSVFLLAQEALIKQSFIVQTYLFPHVIKHTDECPAGVKGHHGTFLFPTPQQVAEMLDLMNKPLSTVGEGEWLRLPSLFNRKR